MRNILVSAVVALLVSVGINVCMKPKPSRSLTIREVLESPVLNRELSDLRMDIKYTESDLEALIHGFPKLTLSRVDRCIDAAESGKDLTGCGSFTDWVEFELESARKAGASKNDVGARIDRVFKMAKAGKYYSGYLQMVDKDNSTALKEYLDRVKQRIN